MEPGWWKRTPAEFGDQLDWCERCSACLPVPKRNANDETDDVSPFYQAELARIQSKKMKNGLVNVFDPGVTVQEGHAVTQGGQPYLDDNSTRIQGGNEVLLPHHVTYLRADEPVPDRADDWIAVLVDPAAGVAERVKSLASHYVFNPGCLYGFTGTNGQVGAWFFNTIAHSLRGVEYQSQPFGQAVFDAFPAAKRIGVQMPGVQKAA